MSKPPVTLGVVMDPIATITPKKDSTLAMMLEAQRRGWQLFYIEPGDLFLRDGRVFARMREIEVFDDLQHWYRLADDGSVAPLSQLQLVLMRKDPPFNIDYIFLTQLLELAQQQGVLVCNRPQALRDANEKLFACHFPQCAPPTLVSRFPEQIRAFAADQGTIVVKPLEGMGGTSIFQLRPGDPNFNVVLETITDLGRKMVMAQRFIPEISAGDKRLLLIEGEPIPHVLARIPAPGEFRGNLAVGARAEGLELSERDRWICQQVGPALRRMGLTFVGLDVIGDYLTEVNVTSPTGIREIDQIFDLNVSARLLDALERQLAARS